jgi:hypothetical protein
LKCGEAENSRICGKRQEAGINITTAAKYSPLNIGALL